MRASQVLSQAWECGHAVAVSLKLGDLGVRSFGLALCDLVRVLELLKEGEVSEAHVVTVQELSTVGEKFANTILEGTQRSFVDLLSCDSIFKDKCDQRFDEFVVSNGVQLHNPCLLSWCGAE